MTAEELRRIRERTGLSQTAFADRLGLGDHSQISRWEKGTREIPEYMARYIRLAFPEPAEVAG